MPLAGRYTIAKKVADGGMAEIFLATQLGAEGFQRTVVLKRILPALSSDPELRHMLVDEAHIAMSLNHGNIVQVLDLGEAEGRTFLVLELVDGWDLAKLVARGREAGFPLPDGLALYVLAETCRALAYAHAKTRDGKPLAVVHRDVSPQNVLVSEQGEVKLTDFGIAKALGRRERTRTGVIKGKLGFMSPEQAAGAPLDARSDIFSAGSVLYTVVTGSQPFTGPSDLETLLRVQTADFPPAPSLRPDLHPGIAAVIDKAMRKLPSERYRSAEEMMIAIEAVLRTDFGSAGQSELKRWVAELGKRDKAPPISRAPGLKAATGGEASPVGRTVALGQARGQAGSDAGPARRPAPPAPPRAGDAIGFAETQAFSVGAEGAAAGVPGAVPSPTMLAASTVTYGVAPRRRRGGSRLLLALVLLAAGAAAAWKVAPGLVTTAFERGRRLVAGLVGAEAKRPAAEPARASRREEPRPAPEPGRGAPDRAAAAAPAAEAPRRTPEKAVPVKIRFDSKPRGALVHSRTKVRGRTLLGRTPFALVLPSGTSLDVTFTRPGYKPESRDLTAGPGAEVRATLDRAPPEKKKRRRR